MTLAPSRAQRLGLRRQRLDVDADLLHQRRVAERERAARRPCRARRCRCSTRSPRGLSSASPRSRAARDDGVGQRMLAALVQARGEAQHLVARRSPATATARSKAGLPSVSVPVLSTISVSTRAQVLDRRGVAEQHALRRRLAASPP